MRGVIIDIGGVLVRDRLLDTAGRWADRLGIALDDMLSAVYGGSDDAVLIGRVTEDEWWGVVSRRLGVDISSLRRELESGQAWDLDLVATLRDMKLRARTAILSNAWPSQRQRIVALELDDIVHDVLLSCEIGCAKPDAQAFEIALHRLGTDPEETLFVDDTASHVAVAQSLGIRGHVHEASSATIDAIRHFVALA